MLVGAGPEEEAAGATEDRALEAADCADEGATTRVVGVDGAETGAEGATTELCGCDGRTDCPADD